ncbi:LTA synthase family protein [Metabacillus kandeliae]|uniref:LTA synthase family protein n=1 Tax=Metabacillus kandeliae TaxID=2900151 RepID=UPI0038CBF97F
MVNTSKSKYSFLLIAAAFMWLKTYIVYKTSFDIKIENFGQELILLINPISFLLFFYGIGLFLKEKNRNRYILGASFVLTLILLANMIFYRFFNDFLTFPILFQTNNMGELGGSISSLFQPADLLLFVDIIILAILMRRSSSKSEQRTPKREKKIYFLLSAAMLFLNLGFAEVARPELLTRSFDREMLVKNLSLYNFHIYDGLIQSKTFAQRAMADSNNLTEIENFVKSSKKKPDDNLFGVAKNRNVIVVSLESTQSFVMNRDLKGEEITPTLNKLAKESYNFENFYHQTGQGKTSDAEFLVDNSLYPLGRGAVFFTNSDNKYTATPELLKQEGYSTAVFHANNKSFWNRDLMYQSFGYDKFFDINSYKATPESSVGWGLKDKEFFQQTADLMKTMPQPFYSRALTLTNHYPFDYKPEDKMLPDAGTSSKTVNNYFQTVRYEDEAVKEFIKKLKENGLYDNSVIVFYGDHYGISENHNAAMEQVLGKKITPYENMQLQRVPFMIHIPGVTDKNPKNIEEPGGQIDIRPTLLHLLGVKDQNRIEFGHDLFSKNRFPFTVMRDGSYVSDKYIYTDGKCFDRKTGQQEKDPKQCEVYSERAKQELNYSDNIINGDLLRFYNQKE